MKISNLPGADPIDGAEIVPIVQDGVTRRTTSAAIAALNQVIGIEGAAVLAAVWATLSATTGSEQIGCLSRTGLPSMLDDELLRVNGHIVSIGTQPIALAEAHDGAIILTTSDLPVALTVPAGLPAGFRCSIVQMGLGQVTVGGGAGATVINPDGLFASERRYVQLGLLHVGADQHLLFGRTI